MLWLRGRGELLFVGMEAVNLDGRSLFPILPDTWIEASGLGDAACELSAQPSPAVLAEPAMWQGLDRFHEAVCRCEFIHRRLAIVDELHRLKSKAEYSEAAREAALRDITSVLEPEERRVEARPEDEEVDRVLSALRLVGRAQGIRITGHPEVKEDRSYEERVGVIAKASGLRPRTVALRDAWWPQDQGPILARFEDRGDPVALLPRVPRGGRVWWTASSSLSGIEDGTSTSNRQKNACTSYPGHHLARALSLSAGRGSGPFTTRTISSPRGKASVR